MRGRDGPEELVGRARVGFVHRGARLGQEVLHDHLLHVTVARVALRDRVQRFEPFGARLTDSDEDPGGERHPGEAGGFERRQPALRRLVGCAVVRPAGLTEPRGERLDHHSLRRRPPAQSRQLFTVERAGVGVREQPGLVDHQLAHRREIVDGRRVAVLGEPGLSLRVPRLGCLAEGEERLVASGGRAGSRDCQHLLGREER